MSSSIIIDKIQSLHQSVLLNETNKSEWWKTPGAKAYLDFLSKLNQILKTAEVDTSDEVLKLHDVLGLIERVPIQGYFENKRLGKFLHAVGKQTVLSQDEINNSNKTCWPLHHAYTDQLKQLHNEIWNYYDFLNKNYFSAVWSLDYPHDKNNQIDHSFLTTWQDSLIEINDSKDAVRDLKRGIRLPGMTRPVHSEKEIEHILHLALQKTKYAPSEKVAIEKWVLSRGGGDMLAFLYGLLLHSHINNTTLGPVKYTSFGSSYSINDEGRFQFLADLAIYGVKSVEDNKVYFVNPEKKFYPQDDALDSIDEEDVDIIKDNKLAILRLRAVTELLPQQFDYELKSGRKHNSNNYVVIPDIKSINVTGYSDRFRPSVHLEHVKELSYDRALEFEYANMLKQSMRKARTV